MSRENLMELINEVPENMIEAVYSAISNIITIMKDAEDDAFCVSLAEAAMNEDDGTRYTMDEVIKELGLEEINV